MNNTLAVVVPIVNPNRYRSRYDLFREFKAYAMCHPNVKVYTVEMAFGSRPFEVTRPDDPCDIQLRGTDELWHKENLINIGVRRLPLDIRYVAWVDGDVSFLRPDIFEEAVQQLQHYPVIQLWSDATDLGPDRQTIGSYSSFATQAGRIRDYIDAKGKLPSFFSDASSLPYGHTGYAWACRRDWFDTVGGLIDFDIVGSGDWHMAYGVIGHIEKTIYEKANPNYLNLMLQWQARAAHYRGDIGHVTGTVLHYWHGAKRKRGYNDRWKILQECGYDPTRHIHYDSQGLLRLNPKADPKGVLRDRLRAYFRSRNEDGIDV